MSESARPLTVGTAGHVDHGKTALVRALTGQDTDRLAEERRRGISIELGFAELDLGPRRLSLVDVPGHERFVRTMVAGASGIDLFLLVVAADDGVMPQTREHMAVLRALRVEAGVVALTKCDLADRGLRELVLEECDGLVPGILPVEVSARTGEGLDLLREALAVAAGAGDREASPRPGGAPLLHVDRAFTIAGHGTVVTGTLWAGAMERGQEVVLLPSGRRARIRALEVHGRRVDSAPPCTRVAVNLRGIGLDQVRRGDAITVPDGEARPTYRLDLRLESGAEAIAAEKRVQAHLGTREAPARVVPLEDGLVQLRLEAPLIARAGDRVVVRRIAPPDTLGGGPIADPAPRRRGPHSRPRPAPESPPPERRSPPAKPGDLARRLLIELTRDGLRPRPPTDLAEATGVDRPAAVRALGELVRAEKVVRLKPDVLYPTGSYARIRSLILERATSAGSTSIAEVRDQLGISRKYAQALLEHLDGEKDLRREGDRHVPRREAAAR
jgi:selenocysteine-specific elongation factor